MVNVRPSAKRRGPRAGACAGGFTLIELLLVMAIIGTLLSLAVPRYYDSVKRAEEATLKQNLALVRDAIDKHYADTGRYPGALDELVAKRYLRAVPLDPVTGASDTWVTVAPPAGEAGKVYDLKSGSPALARDGSALNTW
jgi:general secretion pathway protein G